MKYFHIDKRIDTEMLNRFLEFVNNSQESDWYIIIYSAGGMTGIASSIIDIINKHTHEVSLFCVEAYSSSFDIFYRSKAIKILSFYSKGMVHQTSAEMRMNENGKPTYFEDMAIVKSWKEKDKSRVDYIHLLNKSELKMYKKGEEIYFTLKRMKEIFPNAEVV